MFPIVLNLRGKKVVVFGGGSVAGRRVKKLLEAGAKVKIVAKEFSEAITRVDSPNLELIEGDLERMDIRRIIEESDLIFISTDKKYLNDKIEEEAKKLNKWVNRADKIGDFIIPANLKVGDIHISISTQGKSPAFTKALKRRLKRVITQEDIMLVELQEFARKILKEKVEDQRLRKEILEEILNMPELINSLREHNSSKAKKILLSHLERRLCTQ
jgi:precorrin-2 dehydrogenase/sirohydrochlorin ferrochelatase